MSHRISAPTPEINHCVVSFFFPFRASRTDDRRATPDQRVCATGRGRRREIRRANLSLFPLFFFFNFFSFPFSFFFSSLSDLTPSFSPCTACTHLHTCRALERIQCHSQTHYAKPPRTRARTLSKSRRPRSPHPMHPHCCAHLPTSSLAHAPSWPQQRAHSRAVARLGSLLRCRAAHRRRPASPPR